MIQIKSGLSILFQQALNNCQIQKQINNLALDANEKRYEAYRLEQEALRIMDKEVIYAI